ncbi:MAG: serine--tRNA ligase [Christensenellaceae bacterium]|jgi:seryl-tRNA synthetase|nr:serine--tRNA ligase [Christensenellaceae bacterium]
MLDFRYVVDNIEYVQNKLNLRNSNIDLEEIKTLSNERKNLIKQTESRKAAKNKVSDQIALLKKSGKDVSTIISDMKILTEEIKTFDARLLEVENKLTDLMYSIPNIIDDLVPYGRTSDDNPEIRRWSEPRKFSFAPLPHWELGEKLKILSPIEAAKITGARFTVYRGLGARLERAVYNFMLDTHVSSGYTEIFPPYIVNRESLIGTGQLPKFEDGLFHLADTNYYLIPTAEVPVTNLHRAEILPVVDLPIKYCAYTACFRSEAGAAGRDTRGLIRQHQFNKVELVKFTKPEASSEELESLTKDAESILQELELPHRTVKLCSGDVGFSSAITYDIEVFLPSYNKYVEISSCSNFKDYQARRANIRFRDLDGSIKFVHTLNGSGLAVGRTVAAILENYQNDDGSVSVPRKLIKYMDTDIIK